MSAVLNRRVLVLNKFWTAIGVIDVQRAIVLLFGVYKGGPHKGEAKAHIVDPAHDFQTFTWDDWSQMRPEEGEDAIRGNKFNFKIPEVIMVTSYDRQPHERNTFSRKHIYRRDEHKCQYCGDQLRTEELTLDHIMPRSRGGESTWENCVLCCVPCNKQKANRTPEEAVRGKKGDYHPITNTSGWKGPSPMKLLSVPKKPKFSIFREKAVVPKSWEHFLSEAYWSVPLEK